VDGIDDRFALTFDDGPSARTTPRILDLLQETGDRATLFVLCHNVRNRPSNVLRMRLVGQEVAVHGDRHLTPLLLTAAALRGQVARAREAIVEAGAPPPLHYRPPYGLMGPKKAAVLRELGITPVLGDVYPDDANNTGQRHIVRTALDRVRGGSILILHDASATLPLSRMQTYRALGEILAETRARGLRSVTVTQLREAA
jgi:peptidoglycan/xylan/chitin deacetylase (PgdA/CDA1 family)